AVLLGLCVLFGLPCQHFFASVVALVQRPFHSAFVHAACLLIGCPALALWSAFEEPAPDPAFEAALRENPPCERKFEELSPSPLATDKGRHVRISQRMPEPEQAPARKTVQEKLLKRPDINAKVIALEANSADCNCHGWVFTGGLFWVSG